MALVRAKEADPSGALAGKGSAALLDRIRKRKGLVSPEKHLAEQLSALAS